MEHRVKPTSMEETVSHIWYAIIGTNGEGLISRMAEVEEKLDNYLSKDRVQTCYYLKDKVTADRTNDRRKKNLWSWLKLSLVEGVKMGTAMGLFAAVGKWAGLL